MNSSIFLRVNVSSSRHRLIDLNSRQFIRDLRRSLLVVNLRLLWIFILVSEHRRAQIPSAPVPRVFLLQKNWQCCPTFPSTTIFLNTSSSQYLLKRIQRRFVWEIASEKASREKDIISFEGMAGIDTLCSFQSFDDETTRDSCFFRSSWLCLWNLLFKTKTGNLCFKGNPRTMFLITLSDCIFSQYTSCLNRSWVFNCSIMNADDLMPLIPEKTSRDDRWKRSLLRISLVYNRWHWRRSLLISRKGMHLLTT